MWPSLCRALSPLPRSVPGAASRTALRTARRAVGSLESRRAKPSIHEPPQVMRPGDFVDVATVIRNWWAFPAVGFNSILEMPVQKFEILHADEEKTLGTVVVPSSIFGLPLRKDIIFKTYWYHRRKLQGYMDTMMFYKWEWPGSNKKFRSQKKSGKGRMGRRKAPGRWEGTHCHALRPRDWGKTKVNVRVVWQALKCMLSAKYVQNSLTVVDSFNLQSHKTKHLVQHLRRIVGRKCHSALLIHEGNLDINDNGRWASAHIPAIRRENVEGVSVYLLLKYHHIIITEMALAKLIKEIQSFPKKMNWHQKFATPDGTPAPVPSKVEGWNNAWIEKKERIRNSEFRAREFFKESLKWKWSHDLKGPLKLPRSDDMKGFRVKDFLLEPRKPVWEKLESLYGDDEPLEEDAQEEEFDELLSQLDALEERSAMPGGGLIQDKADITRHGLRQLQVALEEGAAGSKKKEAAAWAQKPQAAAEVSTSDPPRAKG